MTSQAGISQKLKSAGLGLRIVTAAVAILILIAVTYFGGAQGLSYLVVVAIVLATWEYLPIGPKRIHPSRALNSWFILCCGLVFAASVLSDSGAFLALGFSIYAAGIVWLARKRLNSNEQLLNLLSLGFVGLIYCVWMPSFAILTLKLPHGAWWFYAGISMVFAGDVFAYFGGLSVGKTAIYPNLSPKKTVAGAVTGLGGSIVIGALFGAFAPIEVSLLTMSLLGLVVGALGQMGDLLVSLLKRTASVKDSGKLLPGHGGVLDRIDGVIMALPVLYAFALSLTS